MKNFLLIVTILMFFSCKHELENPNWDVDLIIPVATSEISIENLFNDSNISIVNDNVGLINLIYKNDLVNINLDTLVNLKIRTNEESTTLDSVSFKDVTISDSITIGSVINDVPFGPILFPNGSNTSIPSIPSIAQNDTTLIDASEYFETMTLYRGTLIVSLYNGFPTSISNINISLFNSVSQNLIANFNFPIINSGSTAVDSSDISGLTLDENMIGIIHNMDVESSVGSVNIDYQDAIVTSITLSDIGITEATAYFPEQEINQTFEEYSFDLNGVELNEVKIKEGIVTINALSTLPDTGRIIYNIPSLKKNGVSFTSINIIPPSINGEMTTITHNFDGYVLDMTGQDYRIGGDTINTIYTEFIAFIDSTGDLVTINQNDSFYTFIDFDLKPEYAKGHLGQDTISYGPEDITISQFNQIHSGSLNMKEVLMTIKINNFIGANADLVFNQLSASNNEVTVIAGVDQYGENIIGKNYQINSATETGSIPQVNPSLTEIMLDAKDILEIFPNKITSGADFILNPNGNELPGFLYPDYTMNASISAEIPLSFISNNLTLIDTAIVNFNTGSRDIEKLYINIENGFPLEGNISIILIDEFENIIDTIFKDVSISSAELDNQLIVNSSVNTVLESDFNNLLDVKKVAIHVDFSTANLEEYIDIYSSYLINLSFSMKLKQTIGK